MYKRKYNKINYLREEIIDNQYLFFLKYDYFKNLSHLFIGGMIKYLHCKLTYNFVWWC